ncbi:S41 family peptidase [Leadbetterella byssophila]|uniref:S41 family peptidase n=1 Tax=Leadbetterella byssophila TaxID=316068 RepID=UPI0039A28CC1
MKILIVLWLLISISAQAQETDLDRAIAEIRNSTPYPFSGNEKHFERNIDSLMGVVPMAESEADWYRILRPLVLSTGDAHFGVRRKLSSTLLFPYELWIENNKIFILEEIEGQKGRELLAVNGVSSDSLLVVIRKGCLPAMLPFLERRTAKAIGRFLHDYFDWKDQFEMVTPNLNWTATGKAQAWEESVNFKVVEDIGILRLADLQFEEMVYQWADMVEKVPSGKLIIDIRGNLGGSDLIVKELLEVLTREKFNLAEGIDYFSEGVKSYMPILEFQEGKAKRDLNLVLLADVCTYSEAHIFRQIFEHHKLGIVIGEDPSEGLRIGRQLKGTVLPESGLELVFPTINYRIPGFEQERISKTDLIVKPTLQDLLEGKDVALQKALDYLKN